MDPQVTSDLGDRLARLDHDLHGLSFELRAELAAMVWQKTNSLVREALSRIPGTPHNE
jgi:hypothetical protein